MIYAKISYALILQKKCTESIIITNMIDTQQQYLYPCGNLQAAQVGSVFVD